MTAEWIRFAITAFLLGFGVIALFVSLLGVYRFRFALNRIHAAAICDTFCMFFVLLGLAVASGWQFATLKILLILGFMWFTCPLSAHFLTSLEFHTDEHLEKHLQFKRLNKTQDKEDA